MSDKETAPRFQVPPDHATREELIGALQYWVIRAKTAERVAVECRAPAPQPAVETDYYWKDGSLKWGHPVNVEHLILQLQTLDPKMKVSSVHHVSLKEGTKARAYGLSMSRERWNELGWLDWTLDGPECLAIWAEPNEHVHGTNSGAAATPQVTPTLTQYLCKCGRYLLVEGKVIGCEYAQATGTANSRSVEGTSEQASPTPDKCPKCNSADRSGHIVAWAGLEAVYCQDSWHSSAATPKGTK